MRILVVEDDEQTAAVLRRGLEEEGYAVDRAKTGEEGEWFATENPYDAVVLDVGLPGADGFEICKRLRGAGFRMPILLLTARDATADLVSGLDLGADDYLTKPFAFSVLFARVRALIRRGPAESRPVVRIGDLTLDPARHTVLRGGTRVELTRREFALLEYLMRHPGDAVSRTELVEHVWDFAFDNDSNVVDVYIRYLRKKIDRPFGVSSIETVRGVGYRLRAGDGG